LDADQMNPNTWEREAVERQRELYRQEGPDAWQKAAVIVRTWRQYGLVVEITASVSLTRCGASLSTARGSETSLACRSATRAPMLGWVRHAVYAVTHRLGPRGGLLFSSRTPRCWPAADGLGRLQEAWGSSTFSLRCPFNEEREPDVDNGLRTMQQASVDAPTNGNRKGTPTPTVVW